MLLLSNELKTMYLNKECFKNKPFPDAIHWREGIVSRVLDPEVLRERWKKMHYKPKNIQLKLL